MGCYIWYSEEGLGKAAAPRPLLAVSNVTAHPSTASVPITVNSCMMVRCSAVLMLRLNIPLYMEYVIAETNLFSQSVALALTNSVTVHFTNEHYYSF